MEVISFQTEFSCNVKVLVGPSDFVKTIIEYKGRATYTAYTVEYIYVRKIFRNITRILLQKSSL